MLLIQIGNLKNLKKFLQVQNLHTLSDIRANLNNSLSLKFDKTYKLKNYEYKNNGKIIKANLNLKDVNFDYFLNEKINQLNLIETDIITNISPKKILLISQESIL